jgi:DNA helicase-2/ATP-dependent DNA helicase PcrA
MSLGVNPLNILGVTFTNKAASEMRQRVKKLLGDNKCLALKRENQISQYLMPMLGTFHSVCVRILRKEIPALGFKPSFVIYDDDDQVKAIRSVMSNLSLNPQRINPRVIQSLISSAKNELLDPEEYEGYAQNHIQKVTAQIYKEYQSFLKVNQACDFDDLIMSTVKIFRDFPNVLRKYQSRFRFVLVDEYQDTNHAQYVFLNLLARRHKNIFVVGDDWQSIYGWRGANIQNILNFEKDYPEVEVVKLERNYRSTQNILDTAHEVITKNYNQKEKRLWTKQGRGGKVVIYEVRDEHDEGNFIIKEIEDLLKPRLANDKSSSSFSYNDFVILYRTNAQSRALEEVLLHNNIPYKIVGGVRFYERREIKDVLAYLRVIQNSQDSVSLKRIINVPARAVGEVTFKKIEQIAWKEKVDLLAALKIFAQKRAHKKLSDFYEMICVAREKSVKTPLSDLINHVLDKSGYKDFILDGTEEGEMRWENIQELKSVANDFDNVKEKKRLLSFLEKVSLLSDIDELDEEENAVTLMTAHLVKGLEYEVVFMAGMEENIFPHSRSMLEPAELEEERRLCYVGMTRAKAKLYMIYAQARELYGSIQTNPPSRFIEDISDNLVDFRICDNGFS